MKHTVSARRFLADSKSAQTLVYKILLKSFIRIRLVPVQKVDFSLKSAQVFVSIRFT